MIPSDEQGDVLGLASLHDILLHMKIEILLRNCVRPNLGDAMLPGKEYFGREQGGLKRLPPKRLGQKRLGPKRLDPALAGSSEKIIRQHCNSIIDQICNADDKTGHTGTRAVLACRNLRTLIRHMDSTPRNKRHARRSPGYLASCPAHHPPFLQMKSLSAGQISRTTRDVQETGWIR